MIPYVVQAGDVSPGHYRMFQEMRGIFEALPEFEFPEPVSCHIICRAFAENYPVECVDGHFSRGCNHSWLVLMRKTFQEHGENASVIADMYPCGGASPFLVYAHWILPWEKLYIEDASVVEKIADTREFQTQVTTVATEIAKLQMKAGKYDRHL